MNIFEQEWLTRYPYPIKVVMDQGRVLNPRIQYSQSVQPTSLTGLPCTCLLGSAPLQSSQ
jgi:hypothetical protein